MPSDEIIDPEFINFAIEDFSEFFSYIASGRIDISIHKDIEGKMWFCIEGVWKKLPWKWTSGTIYE